MRRVVGWENASRETKRNPGSGREPADGTITRKRGDAEGSGGVERFGGLDLEQVRFVLQFHAADSTET